MIFYCVVTSFVNAVCSLVLGVAVFARDRHNPRNVAFFFLSLTVAAWAGAYFLWQISAAADAALLFCRILTAGAIAIPAAFYHFGRRLVGLPLGAGTVAAYAGAGLLVALTPTPLLVSGVSPRMMFPFWPDPGPLYPVYLLVFGGTMAATWRMLFRSHRRAGSARERIQLRWVLVSTVVGVVGGSTNFLLWYHVPVPPFGNGLVVAYLAGLAYAIVRLRLLEVDYALIKLASYALMILPLSVAFPAAREFAQAVGRTDGERMALWFAASAAVTGVCFGLFPFLKRQIDSLLATTVLRGRYVRREELGELAARITSMRDEEAICGETVRVIHEILGVPVAIYLRDQANEACELRGQAGFPADKLPDRLPIGAPILGWMVEKRQPLVLDEVDVLSGRNRPEPALRRELALFRVENEVELACPIIGDIFFLGALLLGHGPRRRAFSQLDVSLIDSVCGHIGLSLRARQLERRASQVEKLVSLGTLAAGLAHELRNPLVSIKTFSQLLDEKAGDLEFQREFSATVLRDVGRIESIVENVAAFAMDRTAQMSWIRLDEVVRAAYAIVRHSFQAAGVACELDLPGVPPVRGNHNQLAHVVINLLNNAVQALKATPGPCVRVRLRHRGADPAHPLVEISVSDNGPGIDPEIMPRLFEPFNTTKDTGDRGKTGGMGLGLAIVKRIVDGHHGVVRVETKQGAGTTFVVLLPCEGALV